MNAFMTRFVSVVALALSSAVCFAGPKTFSLKSGNPAPAAGEDVIFDVRFDYEDCTIWTAKVKDYLPVDEFLDIMGDDWKHDFPGELEMSEEAFVNEFNASSSKGKVVPGSGDAAFTITLKPYRYCYGERNNPFAKEDKAWISSYVTITDNATGEEIAVFETYRMSAVSFFGTYSLSLTRREGYQHVAEAVAKYLNKQ